MLEGILVHIMSIMRVFASIIVCEQYRDILGPKNHTRKTDNIYKDFEKNEAFVHNFLYQNIPIFPLCILLTKKPNNIHKQFERYQVFTHSFLYQNVPIFPFYILLTKRIDTFWSQGINTFWSASIGTVFHIKSSTKIQQYSRRLFQLFHGTTIRAGITFKKILL